MKIYDIIIKIYLLPVYFYKKIISPLYGNNCNYIPSCSTYFVDSVKKHGIIKGTVLGISRLLRCNKFYMGGPDPVPPVYYKGIIRENRIIFRLKKKSHVQKQ